MQNHIEKEAKILDIDTKAVIKKLRQNGAQKVLDAITVIETYDSVDGHISDAGCTHTEIYKRYEQIIAEIKGIARTKQSLLSNGVYLRLRQEGYRSELILKCSTGKKDARIKSEREISILVRNKKEWVAVQTLLNKIGLKKVFYQEKHRISYVHKETRLRFDIDTWPGVPTYVEIEGLSNAAIIRGARMIGHRISDLRSYKAKEVFKKYSVSPVFLTFRKDYVRVKHGELVNAMRLALSRRGIAKTDADWIVNHYYEAELMGKKTHGIRKFCWDIQFYDERVGNPTVVTDNHALVVVDGNREIGPLAARFCIDLVSEKAEQFGIAMVGLKNFQRYGVLSTWTKAIAEKGLVGIVTNSTEPFVVSPTNKKIPVLGTNPLSIGFPRADSPIVMDMSATKEPMSLVWYERTQEGTLPRNTFLDGDGVYTSDPWLARYVESWGGVKGFNFSFMLQLLSGPLLGVNTERTWESPYEVGAVFIAIDPAFLRSQDVKKNANGFVNFMKTNKVMLPGERGKKNLASSKKKKEVLLSEQVWGWLNLL